MKKQFNQADKNKNNAIDQSELADFFENAGIQIGGATRSK